MHENETKNQQDANDYSRFDKIEASDSDGGEDNDDEEPKKHGTIDECMAVANAHKECGNKYFRGDDFVNAIDSYTKGIWALKHFSAKRAEKLDSAVLVSVTTLLVSLHGNSSQVYLKTQQWGKAITSASCVLQLDSKNVKAMYRRGIAYGRDGLYEDAKADLNKVLEIDPNNSAAKKEIIELSKEFKRHNEKEKMAFGNMFSKGSMYNDKETERLSKVRIEEVDSMSTAPKKQKANKKRSKANNSLPTVSNSSAKTGSSNDKENPRLLQKSTVVRDAKTNMGNSSGKKVMIDDASSVGEVSNMTDAIKAKILNIFSLESSPTVTLPAIDASNPSSLSASLQILQEGITNAANHSPKDNVDRLTASMSQVDVNVMGNPMVNGEAYITVPKDKKKFVYDFVVKVFFEIIMTSILPVTSSSMKDESMGSNSSNARPSNPIKKFRGSLLFSDVSPGSELKSSVKYKKAVPGPFADRVDEAVRSLQSHLLERFRQVEVEIMNEC